MSKFTRVAETENTPDFISNAFMPHQTLAQDDPYAALRAGSQQRRAQIARETLDASREQTTLPAARNWERIPEPARYSERRMLPTDSELSNLTPEDLSGRAIRRASYDVDNGLNARPNPKDFFVTHSDALALMSRGASIWDVELDTLMARSAAERGMFEEETSEQKREKALAAKRSKHDAWQENHMNALRPLVRSAARAHTVVRNSMENVSAGAFGLANYDAMDDHQAQRQKMADSRREQRLSIKAVDHEAGREERHDEWERGVTGRASRLQDHSVAWLDSVFNRD